jgi:predicted nuclease of predicted toxin-antitoxin system
LRLKLDENLGISCAKLLRVAGYDVATVSEEDLYGMEDDNLISACQKEERILVTLDLDFGNPLRFKPSEYAGIAVLRLPSRPTMSDLHDAVKTLIGGLRREKIQGEEAAH